MTAISLMLIVPDAEAAIAWYKDALGAQELWDRGGVAGLHIAAGATPGSPVLDRQMPWGPHRQGGFHDPFGHNWSVGDRSPLQSH